MFGHKLRNHVDVSEHFFVLQMVILIGDSMVIHGNSRHLIFRQAHICWWFNMQTYYISQMFHAWNNLMISYVLSEPQGQVNTTDLETSVSDSSFLILRCDKEPPDDLYQYTDGQQPPSFESTDWFEGKILTRNKRKTWPETMDSPMFHMGRFQFAFSLKPIHWWKRYSKIRRCVGSRRADPWPILGGKDLWKLKATCAATKSGLAQAIFVNYILFLMVYTG